MPQLLYPGNDPVPTIKEVEWALGPVCSGMYNLIPIGFDPKTAQPAVSHCTNCAILTHISSMFTLDFD